MYNYVKQTILLPTGLAASTSLYFADFMMYTTRLDLQYIVLWQKRKYIYKNTACKKIQAVFRTVAFLQHSTLK